MYAHLYDQHFLKKKESAKCNIYDTMCEYSSSCDLRGAYLKKVNVILYVEIPKWLKIVIIFAYT